MIVTEAELRVQVGLEANITALDQSVLQAMHAEAESLVAAELGYDPEQKEHIEYYPRHLPDGGLGYGFEEFEVVDRMGSSAVMGQWINGSSRTLGRTLQLQHLPIRKVLSVRVNCDGRFGATDVLEDQTDESGDPVDNEFEWELGEDFYPEFERPNLSLSGCLLTRRCWPLEPGSVRVKYIAGYSPAELNGRVDADAVSVEEGVGIYSTAGINAAAIKRAVVLTVLKGLHTQQAAKRDDDKGFDGGTVYQSETMQDYSYTRPSESASTASQLTGLTMRMPAEAIQALATFRHAGLMRL